MTQPNLETLIAQWEGGDVIDTRQFVRMLLDERKTQLSDAIARLTDEQRLDLFRNYCPYCGCFDDSPRGCQCWNDE